MATSTEHKAHVAEHVSHNSCPECRPRLAAIREGNQTVEARIWQRDFVRALNNRISSHVAAAGRKHAPEYAKYHLATYGNDFRYLNNL